MRAESVAWRSIDCTNPKVLRCYAFKKDAEQETAATASRCVWPGKEGGNVFCCGYHSHVANRPGSDGRF